MPRICQTLVTGFMNGITTTNTSFQRNLPRSNRRINITISVKKETRATRVESFFTSEEVSNVSVVKYGVTAELIAAEITPDILSWLVI
jgi:hypothetical protein